MYGQLNNAGLVASGLTGAWAVGAWGLAAVAGVFMTITVMTVLRHRRGVPRP